MSEEIKLEKDGFATASMVLGIVGVSLGLFLGWIFPILFIATGAVGLALTGAAWKAGNKAGKNVTGLVLNTLTLVAAGTWTAFWVAAIVGGAAASA